MGRPILSKDTDMDMLKLAELLETAAAALRRDASRDTDTAALPFDGWRGWPGGDEPPADAWGKVVDVRFRNGNEHTCTSAAYSWCHDADSHSDIVAYRIADEQPE